MNGNRSFFQVDLSSRRETLGFLPEHLRNRTIIDFRCIDNIPYRKLDTFRQWMMNRWDEIPEDGKEAFFNGFLRFLKEQTVVIGESSPSISFKVTQSFISFRNKYLTSVN